MQRFGMGLARFPPHFEYEGSEVVRARWGVLMRCLLESRSFDVFYIYPVRCSMNLCACLCFESRARLCHTPVCAPPRIFSVPTVLLLAVA